MCDLDLSKHGYPSFTIIHKDDISLGPIILIQRDICDEFGFLFQNDFFQLLVPQKDLIPCHIAMPST